MTLWAVIYEKIKCSRCGTVVVCRDHVTECKCGNRIKVM